MRRFFVSCLLFFLLLNVCLNANRPSSSIIEERHEILMLGVLSYLHLQANCSKPGHEIAALLAWDVEDVEKTPEFVIDCNRNFEKQGNIFHAEIMTIEAAFNHKRGARTESTEHYYSRNNQTSSQCNSLFFA